MVSFSRLTILSSISVTNYKSIFTLPFPISKIRKTHTLPIHTISYRRNTLFVSSSLFLLGHSFLNSNKKNTFTVMAKDEDSSSSSSALFTTKTSITDHMEMITTGYLNAEDAASLDIELMKVPGYSLEQLMELAGLSVAEAVYEVLPPPYEVEGTKKKKKRVLVVCGPGNNGGDGLVAARHLTHFGYDCFVVYPKPSKGTHFMNLVQQLHDVDVPILSKMPDNNLETYDAVIDALFGFSFQGPPREPLASCLNTIMRMQREFSTTNIISVDVPSGWNVNEGDIDKSGFIPDVLISLTAPKLCAQKFLKGRHYVGGRFLPEKLANKYNIKMPPYPGVSQVMEVPIVVSSTSDDDNYPNLE